MKKVLLFIILLALSAILCGCTITSGLFIGFSHNESDTSINASYVSFDGSIAKRVTLKQGDPVTFSYTGDDNLQSAVKQNNTALCDITDSFKFTAPADGAYDFIVEGKSENGAFSLSWQIG